MPHQALEELCRVAFSLYRRGYAFGSTGNLSIRIGDEVWITPTGESLGNLDPSKIACIDPAGISLNDRKPSKEYPFHLAAYRASDAKAVVHLHSTYTVAVSCLGELADVDPLPPLTPYYLMRVAPLAVLPYFRPGSEGLAEAVEAAAASHRCMLLRNHGSVCLGKTLNEAVDRMEELEATAKLLFILRGHAVRALSDGEQQEIREIFG